MFGFGTQELLIILVLVMIIFGAGKLPQIGSSLGKGFRNFKQGINDADEMELTVEELKLSGDEKGPDTEELQV